MIRRIRHYRVHLKLVPRRNQFFWAKRRQHVQAIPQVQRGVAYDDGFHHSPPEDIKPEKLVPTRNQFPEKPATHTASNSSLKIFTKNFNVNEGMVPNRAPAFLTFGPAHS